MLPPFVTNPNSGGIGDLIARYLLPCASSTSGPSATAILRARSLFPSPLPRSPPFRFRLFWFLFSSHSEPVRGLRAFLSFGLPASPEFLSGSRFSAELLFNSALMIFINYDLRDMRQLYNISLKQAEYKLLIYICFKIILFFCFNG